MAEIDLSQLINYFKAKLIYILFAVSLVFCFSSIYVNRFRVPEYTSNTTILLNQANENMSISTSDVSLNNSLVTTYSEIIKSKRVLRQVIDLLALNDSFENLSSKVKVSAVTGTSIIKISVTDEDPEQTTIIANTIASVFIKEIVNIYHIENISIIDEAEMPEHSSSASIVKIVAISTFIGLVLTLGITFIVFYFDKTIKNEEEIERVTGIPVIGVIPISREKIKASAHRKRIEKKMHSHKIDELPIEKVENKIEQTNKIDLLAPEHK